MLHLKSIFTAMVLIAASCVTMAQDVYISPHGNDSNLGTKNNPVATLERAQSLARKQKSKVVWLATGTYERSQSLVLDARDAGISWSAQRGAEVALVGGRRLDNKRFIPVTEPAILSRLSLEARQKVLQINLRQMNILDYGKHKQFGHSITVDPAPLELFFNGLPLTLARYPNTGSLLIGKVIDKGSIPRTGDYTERGAIFTYGDDRHARWAGQRDIWLQGTFNYGFADDFLRVAAIDSVRKYVKLDQPHLYGLGSGQPYQQYIAYNILDELDTPGEWYLNRNTGVLYLWPPSDVKQARISVSILEQPLICIENTHHVTLRDITLEAGRGMGVYIEGGAYNTIDHCTIRNMGNSGIFMGKGAKQTFPHVTVDDYQGTPKSRIVGNLQGHLYNNTVWERQAGHHHSITNCEVYNTGSGGITLSGGSKKHLVAGHNRVENCKIHDYNRRNRFLWAGINVDGCGNVVRNNEIYNSDCQGIYVHGNEHLFEYNNVHDVALNSNDTSPWYIGRDPSDRGNVVRFNYFHHCGNPQRMTMGIYCDDSTTGVTVHGNVFYKMNHTSGVFFSNTGWDLTVTGNIIVEPLSHSVEISAHYYTWAVAEGPAMFGPKGLIRKRLLESVNIHQPPYKTRYPALESYLDPIVDGKEWQGMRSKRNLFAGNLIVGGPSEVLSRVGGVHALFESQNNFRTDEDPGFIDYKNTNFQLRPNSSVFTEIAGFKAVPFERMGIRGVVGARGLANHAGRSSKR